MLIKDNLLHTEGDCPVSEKCKKDDQWDFEVPSTTGHFVIPTDGPKLFQVLGHLSTPTALQSDQQSCISTCTGKPESYQSALSESFLVQCMKQLSQKTHCCWFFFFLFFPLSVLVSLVYYYYFCCCCLFVSKYGQILFERFCLLRFAQECFIRYLSKTVAYYSFFQGTCSCYLP